MPVAVGGEGLLNLKMHKHARIRVMMVMIVFFWEGGPSQNIYFRITSDYQRITWQTKTPSPCADISSCLFIMSFFGVPVCVRVSCGQAYPDATKKEGEQQTHDKNAFTELHLNATARSQT